MLEAAASARPIITTDRPGCREAVDDGISGFLVKERSSEDLIKKMKSFISLSNSEREQMGLAGREKMVREYDRQIVVEMCIRDSFISHRSFLIITAFPLLSAPI